MQVSKVRPSKVLELYGDRGIDGVSTRSMAFEKRSLVFNT